MGNITALDIASEAQKLTGRTTDQQGAGASLTAGDQLINGFDPESSEAKESRGYLDDVSEAIHSAPSQFNPFNVFRYRRFGIAKEHYDITKHKDSNLYGEDVSGLNQAEDNSKSNIFAYVKNAITTPQTTKYNIGEFQRSVRNPTARQIVDVSRDTSAGPIGPAPYAFNDFIYCTQYGKIPNNRLVTLRRYPHPVEDDLRKVLGEEDKLIQVPLAQALTYFGDGTGNKLNSILPISWDVAWQSLEATVNDINGNEVLADDVAASIGVTDETSQAAIRAAAALASGQDADTSVFQLSGFDEKLQNYIRNAYDSNKGPYWNRVLGPVNVINQTRKRTRGMGSTMFENPINLKFSFSLRSFNLINPKVAMLDLISNFLTLTYNTAPFWGGGYRYFPRTGVKAPLAGSDLINRGDIIGGIKATLEEWLQNTNGAGKDILNQLAGSFASSAGRDVDDDGTTVDANTGDEKGFKEGARDLGNLLLAGKAASLMQTPLTYRSLLEGRPIGEWHMTVGNPLDPMAVMGNLLCTACTMTFSEELGADDFPKEIMFDVTLKHGKPRAKQEIESIFNLGGGPLSFSKLNPPSSAQQTFKGNGDVVDNVPNGTKNSPSATDSDSSLVQTIDAEESSTGGLNENQSAAQLNIYRGRVTNHYGDQFGNSAMLYDYIKKSKS